MNMNATDLSHGAFRLCGDVRRVGLKPSKSSVYVFVNGSRKVMKLLHWERGSYVYYRRLDQGRLHPCILLKVGIGFYSCAWTIRCL